MHVGVLRPGAGRQGGAPPRPDAWLGHAVQVCAAAVSVTLAFLSGAHAGTRVLSTEVRWLLIALTSLLAIYLVGVLVVFSVLSAVRRPLPQGTSPWARASAEGSDLAAALAREHVPVRGKGREQWTAGTVRTNITSQRTVYEVFSLKPMSWG